MGPRGARDGHEARARGRESHLTGRAGPRFFGQSQPRRDSRRHPAPHRQWQVAPAARRRDERRAHSADAMELPRRHGLLELYAPGGAIRARQGRGLVRLEPRPPQRKPRQPRAQSKFSPGAARASPHGRLHGARPPRGRQLRAQSARRPPSKGRRDVDRRLALAGTTRRRALHRSRPSRSLPGRFIVERRRRRARRWRAATNLALRPRHQAVGRTQPSNKHLFYFSQGPLLQPPAAGRLPPSQRRVIAP